MIKLYSTEQVRGADLFAINELKIPGSILMENASISIVKSIKKNYDLFHGVTRIGILSGKGNNGGDSFAVARHLVNSGFSVTIILVGEATRLKGDAKLNFDIISELSKHNSNCVIIHYRSKHNLHALKSCDIIIDGLLGTGAKGKLKEPYQEIISFANSHNAFKVAIDLPSGLNPETASGDTIFNSDLTVTLAEYKSGLFYGKGYAYAGKIEKGSIGLGEDYFNEIDVNEFLIEPEDAYFALPDRKKDSHKYSNGKVLAIAGSGKYPGSAALLSKALFSVGTGAVQLAFPKSVRSLISANIGETVFSAYSDNGLEYLSHKNLDEISASLEWAEVLAIGSGLGRASETVDAVISILKKRKKKLSVIDADAIYALSQNGYSKIDLSNSILTPHHAEFANLLGISVNELEENTLEISREFVSKTKSFLVLKGAPTIIFTPSGDALINSAGNSGMAKFGSGDVLTGVIAGMVSQTKSIEDGIIAGVYLHSLSADLLLPQNTEFGITANKIEENLPNAISFLRSSII